MTSLEAAEVTGAGLAPATLYVLFRPAYDAAEASALRDRCVEFEAGWECSALRAAELARAFGGRLGR